MDYKKYYDEQIGMGIPVFHGSRYQRGHGLGSIFKRFYRWVAPILKTHALPMLREGAQTLGTEAVKTASNIATDAIMGKNIENAVAERAKEAVEVIKEKANNFLQRPPQTGGRKRKQPTTNTTALKKQKLVEDIFSQF